MSDQQDITLQTPSEKAASPSVLRRRRFHVAITEWEAKGLPWLQAAGALIGFVFVLLPAMSKSWRTVIQDIGPLNWIFDEFSRFGLLVMAVFILFAVTNAIASLMWKHVYPGWDARKEWSLPNAKQILDRALYPINRKQEVVFYAFLAQALVSPLLIMILFGVLAFFIRLGGN